jgi:hypothetical protein
VAQGCLCTEAAPLELGARGFRYSCGDRYGAGHQGTWSTIFVANDGGRSESGSPPQPLGRRRGRSHNKANAGGPCWDRPRFGYYGGDDGIRTRDLLLDRQVCSTRLHHAPAHCHRILPHMPQFVKSLSHLNPTASPDRPGAPSKDSRVQVLIRRIGDDLGPGHAAPQFYDAPIGWYSAWTSFRRL